MSVNQRQVQALLDLSISSSSNGVTIPIGYGTNSVDANIIWSGGLTEKIIAVPVKDGNGVTHTLNLYTYTVSFAAAFGEGPGTISKIWGDSCVLYDNTGEFTDYQGVFNSETVYNVGAIVRFNSGEGGDRFFICVVSYNQLPFPAPATTRPGTKPNPWQLYTGGVATAGGQAYPSPTLYSGTDTQDVDPTILAAVGVNNTSAFRGLIYAVWKDLDVTAFNNQIPSIRGIVSFGTSNPSITDANVTGNVDYIIADVCGRCGIDPADIDTLDLLPVVNTAADVYQSDGSGIPALTLAQGGVVNFYQGAQCGAPFLFSYPGADFNRPLPAPKLTYQMRPTDTILWNPYPADSTYAVFPAPGYTSFLPGWTSLNSFILLPMNIVGVTSGGAGPATYDGNAFAPWTPVDVGEWSQANWVMTQCCTLNVAVAGNYTFKCSSNDAVVIGIGNGATRVSGPMVFSTANGGQTMTKTAVKGYAIMMAENIDMGENDNRTGIDPNPQPGEIPGGFTYLDTTLSTFVVNFPVVGQYGIELDYGQHVRARCLNLNWMMNGVQSPILPIATTPGADPTATPFGFLIADQKDGRSVLKELQDAFFFDMAESDFQLKFIRRGAHPSVLTLPQDDLGLKSDNIRVKKTIIQEQDAPRLVTVDYIDPTLDYQHGSQEKLRSSRVVTSLNETKVDLSNMSLSQTIARQIAEKTLYTTWMEREPFEMNLWKAFYSLLDPTDTVDFVVADVTYEQRLKTVGIGQDYGVKAEGVSQLAAAYASATAGADYSNVVVAVQYPYLLLESLDFFLLEDGVSRIFMESVSGVTATFSDSNDLINGT